jgi:tetratricopeptide (TPR) repeat protein
MDPVAEELIGRLRRNPADHQAFVALRAHYHQRGDWASLANLIEGWAGRAPDGAAAAQAYLESGDLVYSALADRERALALYERALERMPTHADSLGRLEAILEESGDAQRLLQVLERHADRLQRVGADPRWIAGIHYRLGELLERRFQRTDRAVLHYRKAFEFDPGHVPAIYGAREIYRNAGNLKAAAQLYEMEIAAEPDLTRRASLLRELAHLRAERLGDLEGAATALGHALAQIPGDLGVMHDLATVLLRRADSAADPARGVADRQQAADLFYQMAQAVPPEHAIGYVEAALDAAPDHDRALALLDSLATHLGRPDLLPVRWVAFLRAAPDAPGALDLRRRLGHAYLEAGQIDDAIVCFEPLLDAGDGESAELLVELYRRAGRDGDVVRALSVSTSSPTLSPERRVARLRELVEALVARGERDGALVRAYEILQLVPGDPEALAFAESELRARGAWEQLRELELAMARIAELPVEARKLRLRSAAELSERELRDAAGALDAWRAAYGLDPADATSRAELAKRLEAAGLWDELVELLEREAVATVEPRERVTVLVRIARVHRDRRQDLLAAVDAWRRARELDPEDPEVRAELCDALVELGAIREAVPLLRQRADAAPRGPERVSLLRTLAAALEEHVGDTEGAFEVSARLLDEEPGDLDALARMERIDTAGRRWDRLLQTLSYRAEVGAAEERAQILVRMGVLADRELRDLDRAAEYYGQALDLAPRDTATLDALCDVYDRAERYRDLVEMLRQRAHLETRPDARAELHRRIARILETRVRNEEAAAEAWEEVLQNGEDAEALRALASRARRRGDVESWERLAARLAKVSPDPSERRDLHVERADLLVEQLARPRDAVDALRAALEVEPGHPPAVRRLVSLGERLGDDLLLAEGLERQLEATEDPGLQVPIAQRLADLYETRLHDPQRAVRALYRWADADVADSEPVARLVRLLEMLGRDRELVEQLDALAGLEQDDDVVTTLVLRAADVAKRKLGDVEGAWTRLRDRVADTDDAKAEEALRTLAEETGRGTALAEFYVRLAQDEARGPEDRKRRWRDAARAFEERAGDPAKALESVLRAFALDLDDLAVLDEVDRLATMTGAFPRLAQVYDTLLRRATDPAQKAELLLRHARLLDTGAGDVSGALDRALRACALSPEDDAPLLLAESLAPRAKRAEELLVVYDRRRATTKDEAKRLDAVLRAARLCDGPLGDRERAMTHVAQAAVMALRDPAATAQVERLVRSLDEARPALGKNAARKALAEAYLRLGEQAEDDAALSAALYARAAAYLESELGDVERAFEALQKAAAATPSDAAVLDALEGLARRARKLAALEHTFETLVRDAFDPKTAVAVARRRAALLAGELGRPADAAEAYQQVLTLAPQDREAAVALRDCLSRTGKYQELLLALDRAASTTKDDAEKVALLKESARVWEGPLRNRYEALDVWKKVRRLVPDDPEAEAAVARLEKAARRPGTDEDVVERRDDEVPQSGLPGERDRSVRRDHEPTQKTAREAPTIDSVPPTARPAPPEPSPVPAPTPASWSGTGAEASPLDAPPQPAKPVETTGEVDLTALEFVETDPARSVRPPPPLPSAPPPPSGPPSFPTTGARTPGTLEPPGASPAPAPVPRPAVAQSAPPPPLPDRERPRAATADAGSAVATHGVSGDRAPLESTGELDLAEAVVRADEDDDVEDVTGADDALFEDVTEILEDAEDSKDMNPARSVPPPPPGKRHA